MPNDMTIAEAAEIVAKWMGWKFVGFDPPLEHRWHIFDGGSPCDDEPPIMMDDWIDHNAIALVEARLAEKDDAVSFYTQELLNMFGRRPDRLPIARSIMTATPEQKLIAAAKAIKETSNA